MKWSDPDANHRARVSITRMCKNKVRTRGRVGIQKQDQDLLYDDGYQQAR